LSNGLDLNCGLRHKCWLINPLCVFRRAAGWPHQNVSGLYAGATAVLAVLQWLLGLRGVLFGAVAVISAGLWLDKKQAVPFAWTVCQRRRTAGSNG